MQKTLLLSLLLAAALVPGTQAQNNASQNGAAVSKIGTVNVKFDKAVLDPTLWHLTGHAKITSDNYDLVAADIKVLFAPGAKTGASGLRSAIAVGGAVPGAQVVAHIRQPLQSASYTINSDRAVYQPDTSRPSGGFLKFTGHVTVITKSGFLAEPSVTTTVAATILLGVGADYPEVQMGAGHITATPAQ